MTVRKRKSKNGFSKEYHYQFSINGKMYCGVCVGCETEKTAKKYEAQKREELTDLRKQKSVTALVENYRRELTGGTTILLADAFGLAQKKPRGRTASETQLGHKRSYWKDF